MIPMFSSYLAVLAVAIIYYTWRDAYRTRTHNRAVLNERVAYMLWVAAQRAA
ncbi:MAG: hypothetical protein ACRCZF_10255 [Gemmataceae bacterium]